MEETEYVPSMCEKSADERDRHGMVREAGLFRGIASDLDNCVNS